MNTYASLFDPGQGDDGKPFPPPIVSPAFDRVRNLALSDDGTRLLTSEITGTASIGGSTSRFVVRLWNTNTSRELDSVFDYAGPQALRLDNQLIASGSKGDAAGHEDEDVIYLWVPFSHVERARLVGATTKVDQLVFSPDGQWLASASHGDPILLWQVATLGAPLTPVTRPTPVPLPFSVNLVQPGLISPNNASRLTEVAAVPAPRGTLAWQPDGKGLIVYGQIGWWRYDPYQPTAPHPRIDLDSADGFPYVLIRARLSPDGGTFGFASSLMAWDTGTGQGLFRKDLPDAPYASFFGFSPDGNQLVISSGWDMLPINIWHARTGIPIRSFPLYERGAVIEVSPDGRWIAHPTLQEPKVTLIDLATGQDKFIFKFVLKDKKATFFLPWLLFSPDSKRFAAYDPAFESLILWDVNIGQSRVVIPGPSASPMTWLDIPAEAAFSPDSRLFAVRIDSTSLKLFDVNTGQIRAAFPDAGQLAFSPDGRLLAVNSGSTIRIWDVQTQHRVIELPGGGSVAFSPDGHWLAAVNGLILRLWSVPA